MANALRMLLFALWSCFGLVPGVARGQRIVEIDAAFPDGSNVLANDITAR